MPTRTPRPQKPAIEMSEGERRHADALDSRCLTICIGMLERVNSVSKFLYFCDCHSLPL